MTPIMQRIYNQLPLFFQNIAISMFGLLWHNRRYGGVFKKELEESRSREFYSEAEWRRYQEEQLQKLLLHSYDTVPYYRQMFDSLGISRESLGFFTLEKLKELPLLDKNTYRKLGTTELLSSMPEPHCKYLSSSGSTGTPTKTLYSGRMHQKYFAIIESRLHNWAGIDYKVPRGMIGGRKIIRKGKSRGPFYRYNIIEKQTYFSAFHISASTASDYIKGMVRNKVEYMTGYASSNYFLARFIEENGLKAPQMRAVLTSSEMLTREMRDTFKRVYGCKTFDSYNGVEVTCLVSECEHGKLHISPDVGIVEILDEQGNPCLPGVTGEVVTTGLLNFNQPLIRYRMGDLLKLSIDQTCPCHRNMPVVEEIVGRIEDTVIGADGREMVRFHGVFYDIPSIVEGQIIQNTLTDFEVKVVLSKALSKENIKTIRKRMESQLGPINLIINTVDDIPRNANGKFVAVVSNVKRNSNISNVNTPESDDLHN
jgi:phenylacetate-CoA ligase